MNSESEEGLDLRDDWERLVEENAALRAEVALLRGSARPGAAEPTVLRKAARAYWLAWERVQTHATEYDKTPRPEPTEWWWTQCEKGLLSAFNVLRAGEARPGAADPQLIEAVSAEVHRTWMEAKRAAGVESRKLESGEELMVPYAELSEQAKELDRGTVRTVLSALHGVRGALSGGAAEPQEGP